MNSLTLNEVRQLAETPAAAASRVPELLVSLQDADDELGGWIADALREVERVPADNADAIAALCSHASPAIAGWACTMASRLQTPPPSLQVAVAVTLVTHDSISTRQQAARALGEFPALTAASLTALETAAAGNDPRLSRLARQAITAHQPAA